MCGIAGSYRARSTAQVQHMIARLTHRGPDGSGQIDTSVGSLGHSRLAIVDVDGGHQPLRNDRAWISFNGEIYNHQDLRRQYLDAQSLHTRSDTEVILQLYARFGPQFVSLLDGMFALAILDDDELFLARDPLGIKPLYIGMRGQTLYFASEIKALAHVTDAIHEFPPGCWYHSALGETRYYTIGSGRQAREPLASAAQALPAIRTTLHTAVRKRLMADVPIGISLSGRWIAALWRCWPVKTSTSWIRSRWGSRAAPILRRRESSRSASGHGTTNISTRTKTCWQPRRR